jgi:UDP-galactopyranose mutase
MSSYVIVGAGISGATIARILADSGKRVSVFELENHVGGACYDIFQYGIPVCQFGCHVFHTKEEEVWNFVNRFSEFYPYELRVIAKTNGELYPMPINLLTLREFGFQNPRQAREYFRNLPFVGNKNFEEVAISSIGGHLYKKFFYEYTMKQWGIDPKNLPSSIFNRLPVRFGADTRYFSDPHQGMPRDGYTRMIENMLDHKNINLRLGEKYDKDGSRVIYTGSIDEYHKYKMGFLEYRSIAYKWEINDEDEYGSPLINYVSMEEDFTRIVTFNHFYPHKNASKFISAIEYPGSYSENCGKRLYPIPTEENLRLYEEYKVIESKAIFAGRLGSYKYINMDVAVKNGIDLARSLL